MCPETYSGVSNRLTSKPPHTHTHRCRQEHRFISQHTHPAHIYEVTFLCVFVRDGTEFGPRRPPVGSMWPLPLSVSLSLCHFSLSLSRFLSVFLAVITLIHFLLLARLLHSLWLKKAFIYPVPLGHTHKHTLTPTLTHIEALVRAGAAPPDHRPRQAPLAPITLITS